MGNIVVIKHSNGQSTVYAHLSDNSFFEKGQKVTTQDVIGLSGNTGPKGTDYHLHFEVLKPEATSLVEANKSQKSLGILPKSEYRENPLTVDASNGKTQPTTIQPNKIIQDSIDTGKAGGYEHDFSDGTSFESNLDTESLQAQLNSIQAKQTTTFLTELNLQLPYLLPTMIARLAMGEDLGVVSADMATRNLFLTTKMYIN